LRGRSAKSGDDHCAAAAGGIPGGPHRPWAAYVLEGVVKSVSTGESSFGVGELLGCDRVRRAESLQEGVLSDRGIDGDDDSGTGQARSLDGGGADAAAADDNDGRSGLDFGRVDHGADAGHNGAAHERGDLIRDRIVEGDHVSVGNHHLLCPSPETDDAVAGCVRHLEFGQFPAFFAEEAIIEALTYETGWGGFAMYFEQLFIEEINNLGYMSALREVPEGQSAEVDRLRTAILRGFEELIERAKAEGAFRADRWIEDVLLLLFVNEHLIRGHETEAAAASRRLFALALDTLATRPHGGEPCEPEDVLTLRRTLGNSLAGLAVNASGTPA
jgi:hypothetical protein